MSGYMKDGDFVEEIFQDGDYYTAQMKIKGKKEPIKFRGIVSNVYGEFELLHNNTELARVSNDPNTTEEGWSYAIRLDGNSQDELDQSSVLNFRVVRDKRMKAVIDRDVLPTILGHTIRVDGFGDYEFGCGAVTLSREDVEDFLHVYENIEKNTKLKSFFSVLDRIAEEQGLDDANTIKSDDIKRLLELTKKK